MRLLVLSQTWEPEQGPAQWRMRRFLSAWVEAGNEATVLTAPPHHPAGKLSSTDPAHAPGAVDTSRERETILRTAFKEHDGTILARILDQAVVAISTLHLGLTLPRDSRPAAVLAAVPSIPSAFSAAVIAFRYRVPLTIDLRDAWPDLIITMGDWDRTEQARGKVLPRALLGRATRQIVPPVVMALFRRSSLLITTSDHLRASLNARGVPNTVTIRNTYPIGQHRVDRPEAGETRPLRILYAGTVGRAQGLDNAVRAAALARKSGVSLEFRILGDGAELPQVKELAERLAAPVTFLPPVPKSEVEQHYRWCDAALIHLRDWAPLQQTIPSKLVDLMALGVPVCVAADGEPAEIAEATRAGEAVKAMDPDALATLWSRWAEQGVPRADQEAVAHWLDSHADPEQTATDFVQAMYSVMGNSAAPRKNWSRTFPAISTLVGLMLTTCREDPVHFATLVSRKLPATRRDQLTTALSSMAPTSGTRALVNLVGDRTEDATRSLGAARSSRVQRAVAWRLAAATGHSQTTGKKDVQSAREAWAQGDIDTALSLAPPDSFNARRWRSTLAVLAPTFDPRPRSEAPGTSRLAPEALRRLSAPSPPGALRALHLVTNSLPHTQSGYSLRTHSLLRALASVGVDVVAVSRAGYPGAIGVSGSAPLDVVDDISYLRMSPNSVPAEHDSRLRVAVALFTQIARIYKPDVLHTTTDYENAAVVRAVSQETGIPWVYETRGEPELTWLSGFFGPARDRAQNSQRFALVRAAESRAITSADAVIALSEVQRDSHIDRGAMPDRITVVPNAVEQQICDLPLCSSSEARTKVGVPEGFTVGTVSALVGYEGLDSLIRAIALARAQGAEVRGLIVGDGSARPSLEKLAESLGVAAHITFAGKIAHTRIVPWYDAIDLFCVPRTDSEVTRQVTPLKVRTAMARERAIVCSDLPALVEAAGQGNCGPVVAPQNDQALAEAIIEMMSNPSALGDFAAAARQIAVQHTWRRGASSILETYASLAGR